MGRGALEITFMLSTIEHIVSRVVDQLRTMSLRCLRKLRQCIGINCHSQCQFLLGFVYRCTGGCIDNNSGPQSIYDICQRPQSRQITLCADGDN